MENPELVVGSHELGKYLLIRDSEFAAVSNYTLFAKNTITSHNSFKPQFSIIYVLHENSFASKKWSFQFMINIKMAILINCSL